MHLYVIRVNCFDEKYIEIYALVNESILNVIMEQRIRLELGEVNNSILKRVVHETISMNWYTSHTVCINK